MTFLEAVKYSVLAVGGVATFMLYFKYAFEWATDPHNYKSNAMKARKYLGYAMIVVGAILTIALALYASMGAAGG